jgi:hypothetical protein
MRAARLALVALAGLAPPARAMDDLPRTIMGDIDGDGVPDKVVLSANATGRDQVDVTITLSRNGRTVRVAPLLSAQGLLPSRIEKGELTLAFNWLQGRYKSATTYVIGMEAGDLVVRRYEMSVVDSITPTRDRMLEKTCKADFVANRATINGAAAMPAPGAPTPLSIWHPYHEPKACEGLF